MSKNPCKGCYSYIREAETYDQYECAIITRAYKCEAIHLIDKCPCNSCLVKAMCHIMCEDYRKMCDLIEEYNNER